MYKNRKLYRIVSCGIDMLIRGFLRGYDIVLTELNVGKEVTDRMNDDEGLDLLLWGDGTIYRKRAKTANGHITEHAIACDKRM